MPRVNRLGRIAGSLLAALLTTLLATQVALADPPDSSGVVSHFYGIGSFSYYEDDGLTALGGPPPEQGCFGQGFDDLAVFTLLETPSGVFKVNIRQGPTPVFVYDLTLDEICGTLIGGGTVEPLYVGEMTTVYNETHPAPGHSLAVTFGTSSHGTVWDADGNQCLFSGHDRVQITRDGAFKWLASDIVIKC